MANITLAGNLSAFTANADLTRASGNNSTVSGSVLVAAGTSATINQNLFANSVILTGGTSEATRTTVTIGRQTGTQGDFGVVVKSLINTGWGYNGGSFPTSGFSTLQAFNSILQTAGGGPSVGMYNGSTTQANVKMEFVDSQIHNYTDNTFVTLGSGEPMVAPNSRLIRTKFLGCQTVWINGSPTADSTDVSTITPDPTLGQGGFGVAQVTDPVTLRKFTGDCFVLQSNPAAFNLIDCQITHSIKTNSGSAGRVYQLGKSFGTNLFGIGQQTLLVLDNTNTVLASTSANGNISGLETYWGVFSPAAGTYNIPVAEIPTLTARANWTVVNKLPLTAYSWSFDKKINTTTLTATSLELTTTNAKNQVTVAGVAVSDSVTGTAAQAAVITGIAINATATLITVSAARSTQQIYNYIKYWLSQSNNIQHYQKFSFDGTFLDVGSCSIAGLEFAIGSIKSTGSLTATGALQNLSVTGNVTQASPTNLSNVPITGSLTYNTNTPTTITLTNSNIGGTISNTGTAAVTLKLANSTIGTLGSNVVVQLVASLNLTGLQAGSSVYVTNGSDVQVDYVASSGTSYTLDVTGGTGTWKWAVKSLGYEHATGSFTPSTGGTFTFAPSMPQKLNADGSAMYTGSTSVFCTVSFNGATQANIDIADGSVSVQQAFDASERALVTAAGLRWLSVGGRDDLSQFLSASGNYLFLTNNWRLRRAAAGNVNSTLLGFASSTQSVPVDGVNGGVLFNTATLPSEVAKAVWEYNSRALTVAQAQNEVYVTDAPGVVSTSALPSVYVWTFAARNPSTGIFVSTASNITAVIKRGSTNVALTMTPTLVTTGQPKTEARLPTGTVLQVGDVLQVSASITIDGSTYASPVLTSTVVATDNSLTVANIVAGVEGSSIVAKEATVASRSSQESNDAIKAKTDNLPASPAAVGSAMTLTSAYDAAKTAAPTASQNATATRTELTPELGRMDATVSSRLASGAYTAPTAPPTAAQNATAVRSELTTELARIDVATSTRLAIAGYTAPTAAPTPTQIKDAIEVAGGKLDTAMKAAKAAKRQTL